jgi:DNA-binding GntR family transcriptional regulator
MLGASMVTSFAPEPGTDAARAYDFAKWAILNGVYASGELITETGLAGEIGVAHGAVREALVRLEVEGLVRTRSGSGVLVNTFSPDEIDDVLDARVMVENYTARRSFAHREGLLPRLREAHEEMARRRTERDTAGFTAADRLFHELIVDAAGNRILSEQYRALRERQTLFTSTVMRGRQDRMADALAEHQRILDVLAGDDVDAFCAVVNAHLQWSIELARASRG